jgi:hypothetical protein
MEALLLTLEVTSTPTLQVPGISVPEAQPGNGGSEERGGGRSWGEGREM